MTGIERLREFVAGISPATAVCGVTKTSYDREHKEETWTRLRDFLSDITDQIGREQGEAVAWVRECGGIEVLSRMFQDADNRRVELCGALGIDLDKGWSEAMAAMRRRLMPEGCEWPLVDGKPAVIGERLVGYGSGDDGYEVVGVRPTCGWVLVKSCDHIHRDGGPVILEWDASKCHRPAPKVLDADGVEIRVGDTVWATNGHGPFEVTRTIHADRLRVICDDEKNGHLNAYPEMLTHRAPVLAADGKPLREGEHVYHVETGAELVVKGLPKPEEYQAVVVFAPPASHLTSFDPDQLTHERHVADTWERIEADVMVDAKDYCESRGISPEYPKHSGKAKCEDLVRRCRALAERERGE